MCGEHVLLVVCRFIELDEGEAVESVTQADIVQVVDVTSAQKVRGSESHYSYVAACL